MPPKFCHQNLLKHDRVTPQFDAYTNHVSKFRIKTAAFAHQGIPQAEVWFVSPIIIVVGQQLTIRTGVLGATGSVGQRFILLLAQHPHFTLHAVGASERSAGKKYKDAVRWKQAYPMSQELGDLVVKKCVPEEFSDCDLVFSGLDSDVAGDVGVFFSMRLTARLIYG
jgi:hypothetical protein